jgi:N-acetylglucosamine-6-sulfatase
MDINIDVSTHFKGTKKSPNLIFIYTDDQRYDALGVNGNDVIITPELDKLADEGMRFTNANVVFSLCSPSRAALLTGRYGSANGVLQLGSDLNKNEKTVAQYLKDNGYITGLSGKWHIGRSPVDAGFDFAVWFEGNGTYYGRTIYDTGKEIHPEMHCDLYCVKRSIDFIREAAAGNKQFFLFHNTQTPHMNGNLIWDARVETTKKYKATQMPVAKNRLDDLKAKPDYLKLSRNLSQAKVYGYPDAAAIQQHTLEYYSVITEMDGYLGLLFHELEDLGIKDNTYIFL